MVIEGDCREALRGLGAESVRCCVTSPPYWGLRSYGTEPLLWGGDPECEHEWGDGIRIHKGGPHGENGALRGGSRAVAEAQAAVKDFNAGAFCQLCGAWRGDLGLEPTPELYVEHIVEVFREVRRVLRPDGTLWLNLGDCYANDAKWGGSSGLKPKDLVGMPWRVAFALQADGWWLRSAIVWHKPNPMPESVRDRPTSSYEHVFLLARSEKYFYDAGAIAEPVVREASGNSARKNGAVVGRPGSDLGRSIPWQDTTGTRNARNVWTIPTKPFPAAHFATFPPELAKKCILAGSRPGDTVLDPFGGAGTVGVVAEELGRDSVLIELNPEYIGIIERRLASRPQKALAL